MRIGLVDVDGHNFPNIALMKLSAWHKRRGDTVEFADPAARRYDKVYMSKVFTFSRDCTDRYDCEVVRAGTGYRDYATMLPEEIEHICPDYPLYGVGEAYGFLTRGCVNHCRGASCPIRKVKSGHTLTSKNSSTGISMLYCSTTMSWLRSGDLCRSRRSSAWASG